MCQREQSLLAIDYVGTSVIYIRPCSSGASLCPFDQLQVRPHLVWFKFNINGILLYQQFVCAHTVFHKNRHITPSGESVCCLIADTWKACGEWEEVWT